MVHGPVHHLHSHDLQHSLDRVGLEKTVRFETPYANNATVISAETAGAVGWVSPWIDFAKATVLSARKIGPSVTPLTNLNSGKQVTVPTFPRGTKGGRITNETTCFNVPGEKDPEASINSQTANGKAKFPSSKI